MIFSRKMFFSIGRNCLPEAKLGEYVVHIIDKQTLSIELNISHHMKGKPTAYVYLVKNASF